tara:strand:- start:332 stop:517 length:186 start_codon:yes stop_codon:yes gene_type:complete
MINDSERNELALRIARKIQQDNTSYDEQNQSILEQYIKYAVSLGAPKSEVPEIIGESFLYL